MATLIELKGSDYEKDNISLRKIEYIKKFKKETLKFVPNINLLS